VVGVARESSARWSAGVIRVFDVRWRIVAFAEKT